MKKCMWIILWMHNILLSTVLCLPKKDSLHLWLTIANLKTKTCLKIKESIRSENEKSLYYLTNYWIFYIQEVSYYIFFFIWIALMLEKNLYKLCSLSEFEIIYSLSIVIFLHLGKKGINFINLEEIFSC